MLLRSDDRMVYVYETTNSEYNNSGTNIYNLDSGENLVMIPGRPEGDEPETRVIPESVTHAHTMLTMPVAWYVTIGLPKNYTRRTPRP
jgi:hypothetical protein